MTMFAVTTLTSQTGYDKVEQFDITKDGWAMVKLDGKYGFIDKDGKEVVKPIYDKIEQFDITRDGWAKVKLNGKDLGVLWCPPYQVSVAGLLKTKGNILEVEIDSAALK